MSHSLIIRNGSIVDGSGRPGYPADIAVDGDRIAAIGTVSGQGDQEIDADGLVVTPGFIDGHTHMDAQVMWDPLGTCSCWHGVTTVVMGNCGFTLAPARGQARELVVRSLERAEDISAAAMAAGIDWTWETFPEYLDAVDRVPKGINYASYIGHSALRTWAMGERAFEGPANEDDLKEMVSQLRAAIGAGAIGFTTSRTFGHQTSDDRPVASRQATWQEVCQLVDVMREADCSGIFEMALGPGGRGDPEDQGEILSQVGDLAVGSGVRIMIPVLAMKPECYELLELIDVTATAGGSIFGQTTSRSVSSVLSFKSHLPFDVLPEWMAIRALPLADQKRRLRDPVIRRQLVDAANNGNYGTPSGAEVRGPDYKRMCVLDRPIPPNATVAELAAHRRVDPVELIIDLALDSDFEQFFIQPIIFQEAEDTVAVMKHPRTVMTFSDSGAHVSQIMDASIQTHLLAYWVRERQAFTLEEGVRMLTSVPSRAWGFADRGRLREGLVADINVFDPHAVGPAMPKVVNDLPANAVRLEQRATGFAATIVAGQIVLRDGEPTGLLPGRLLRRYANAV